jgi:ribonucleotide monophosphatase NagD (HAD superfamily)
MLITFTSADVVLESDIRGGSMFESPRGIKWSTILVETGVHTGGEPAWKPTKISKDVYEAVRWAFEQEESQPNLAK